MVPSCSGPRIPLDGWLRWLQAVNFVGVVTGSSPVHIVDGARNSVKDDWVG